MKIIRFGIAMEKELLQRFDTEIKSKGYFNRSEAIRDLIRNDLIKLEWMTGKEVAGTITIVYNHHKRDLLDKLTDTQHAHRNIIISTQHIHLEKGNCLEVIIIRGKPAEIKKLGDELRSMKGVKHAALSMATTGKGIV